MPRPAPVTSATFPDSRPRSAMFDLRRFSTAISPTFKARLTTDNLYHIELIVFDVKVSIRKA
jgi:hypothetical protein